MLKKLGLLAAALVGVVSGQTIPVFPSQFNALNEARVVIFQGGSWNDTSNLACCDLQASQCKIQTEGQSATLIADGTTNNTAIVAGDQAIISIFGKGIEKQVAATKKGSTWTCTSYCPLDGTYSSPVAFDPSAKYDGKATLDGKLYDKWSWFDGIGPIHMDSEEWYVNVNGTSPVPYFQSEELTPFNSAEIGASYQKFENFQAGTQGFNWDVAGLDNCEEDKNCNNNGGLMKRFFETSMKNKRKDTHVTASKKGLKILNKMRRNKQKKLLRKHKKQQQVLKASLEWPNDWTATDTQTMKINQGGYSPNAGELCCLSNYYNQCQVQTQYESAKHYLDYTNQRERFEFTDGTVQVNLFGSTLKAMEMEADGLTCKYYCPIQSGSAIPAGKDYFVDPSAVSLGKVKYDGGYAEMWQWNETLPILNVTMEYTNFYSTLDYIPLAANNFLTPFGAAPIGEQDETWGKDFKVGTPDASKFAIKGVDTCPQDPQGCGNNNNNLVNNLSSKRRTSRLPLH